MSRHRLNKRWRRKDQDKQQTKVDFKSQHFLLCPGTWCSSLPRAIPFQKRSQLLSLKVPARHSPHFNCKLAYSSEFQITSLLRKAFQLALMLEQQQVCKEPVPSLLLNQRSGQTMTLQSQMWSNLPYHQVRVGLSESRDWFLRLAQYNLPRRTTNILISVPVWDTVSLSVKKHEGRKIRGGTSKCKKIPRRRCRWIQRWLWSSEQLWVVLLCWLRVQRSQKHCPLSMRKSEVKRQ